MRLYYPATKRLYLISGYTLLQDMLLNSINCQQFKFKIVCDKLLGLVGKGIRVSFRLVIAGFAWPLGIML